MCGINGFLSKNRLFSEDILQTMNSILRHRGPDAEGMKFFVEGPLACGLGHVRLSIIDLVGGIQPMSNEDGTIWITYNGEVYNHQELRKDLEEKGHKFKTRSDTEIPIHLYEEYGEDSPNFLRGMFAYAIWDDKKKKLFIVRDRLGIKPLYYAQTADGVVFASEIKALIESGAVTAKLAENTLSEYFSFGYLTNEQSLFDGIKKLLPGHSFSFEPENGGRIRQYWNIEYARQRNISEVEATEHLKHIFYKSVKRRMMSDVPLGMFLSGGLDSSAISGVMSQLSSQPFKAFTIGFEKKYYSESNFAKLVADKNNMKMYEVILTPQDFVNSIEKLIWHNDMPIHFPASIALYFISKKAREHVKVVLTGEGSDELFGGYGRYMACHYNVKLGKYLDPFVPEIFRSFMKYKLWKMHLPLKLKKIIGHSFLYHSLKPENIIFDNYYKLSLASDSEDLINKNFIRNALQSNPYENYLNYYHTFNSADTISKMLYTDKKTYLEELLMKQDKMSMAASIESRVPFLDHEIVEYAVTLPSSMKVRLGNLKYVLKEAVKGLVPSEIVHRKKVGFPVPLSTWMRERFFNNYMREILLDGTTKGRGLYNLTAVESLLKSHENKIKDNSSKLWMLLNFELWCRKFLDETH